MLEALMFIFLCIMLGYIAWLALIKACVTGFKLIALFLCGLIVIIIANVISKLLEIKSAW